MEIDLITRAPNARTFPFGPDVSSGSARRVSVGFNGFGIDPLGTEAAQLSALVFAIEGFVRSHPSLDMDGSVVHVRGCSIRRQDEVAEILQAVIDFCLEISIEVKIEGARTSARLPSKLRRLESDVVLLFSGGTDSLAGLRLCEKAGVRNTPVFVAHGSGLTGVVNRLARGTLSMRLAKLRNVRVERRGNLQQTRGFLYAVLGSIIARALDARNLIVSESGPTMFIPPMCPLDEVTLTTSPVVLSLAQDFVKTALDCEVRIQTPFRNITKAESIAGIRTDPALSRTNSCALPQYRRSPQPALRFLLRLPCSPGVVPCCESKGYSAPDRSDIFNSSGGRRGLSENSLERSSRENGRRSGRPRILQIGPARTESSGRQGTDEKISRRIVVRAILTRFPYSNASRLSKRRTWREPQRPDDLQRMR